MALSLVVCVTVGFFVVQRFRRRRRCKDLYQIPVGPGCVPILGHISVLKALKTKKIHQYFSKLGDAAGEGGILRFTVLGETRVFLSAPHTIAVALNKSTFLAKPGGVYDSLFMFGLKEPNVALLSDPQEHARVRRHMMKFFNAGNITKIVEELGQEVRATLAAIAAADSTSEADSVLPHKGQPGMRGPATSESGPPSDGEAGVYGRGEGGVLVDAMEMASGNVARVVFRVFLETEEMAPLDTLTDAMHHITTVGGHHLHFQLLKRGLLPGYRRYRRNWKTLHDYHCRLTRDVYSRPMPEGSTAFWATVRHAFPNAMSDPREFETAAANLSLYIAAYETTSTAITHTLTALALDQDSQAALAEELREAGLLASPAAPEPRAITREDLASLVMLDAICHESLRIMPPAPIGGLRELNRDTSIGGYVVPKGTGLIIPPCVLHTSKHAWGQDAERWRPERWLEGRSVAAARATDAGLSRFMPFFDGPANCIGQHLAMAELRLVVASIVRQLHITPDAQLMAHMRTVDDYVATTVTAIGLSPDGPCWLRMRRRCVAAP